MYRNRYAELPETRIRVVENGYEEESFADLPGGKSSPLNPGKITLLHSGVVYPNERDPTQLFAALRRLMNEDPELADKLRVRLRASGHESLLRPLIEKSGVAQIVELAPSVPYREALQEMMRADGLLVLQAANCNDQVPAKVYEYLRCGRPILALTDPGGETAALLRRARVDAIAPLDAEEQIQSALRLFLAQTLAGRPVLPDRAFAREGSRQARTREFVGMLEECVGASVR